MDATSSYQAVPSSSPFYHTFTLIYTFFQDCKYSKKSLHSSMPHKLNLANKKHTRTQGKHPKQGVDLEENTDSDIGLITESTQTDPINTVDVSLQAPDNLQNTGTQAYIRAHQSEHAVSKKGGSTDMVIHVDTTILQAQCRQL